MGRKVTIGGERLGSGNKMKTEVRTFGRSTHNQGKIITTSQAAGPVVPYYCNIGTRGDTFYIDLATKVRTQPTSGPVFGSFKHQIDVFQIPIRLYISELHNNATGVGLKMENVYLPAMELLAKEINPLIKGDLNEQSVNQSSLAAYLGIRGTGWAEEGTQTRTFPAIFLLAYWDIYKNYYSNKQEEVGAAIGIAKPMYEAITYEDAATGTNTQLITNSSTTWQTTQKIESNTGLLTIRTTATENDFRKAGLTLYYIGGTTGGENVGQYVWNPNEWDIQAGPQGIIYALYLGNKNIAAFKAEKAQEQNERIETRKFPLSNIDDMRERILRQTWGTKLVLGENEAEPYSFTVGQTNLENNNRVSNCYFKQAGLGLRTYLSDRFNNWMSTEWLDGVSGINEITAVDVSDGKLKLDSLVLAKKVYNMLNRIAISGGTYEDWQESVYGIVEARRAESPIFEGGMSSEITFDEVVSTASSTNQNNEDEPLGSLAARGSDHGSKGGRSIKIKCKEPTMIMVLGSIVPRITYSQGNKWWNRLETMNDLHKPDLDGIGFQELITEEFAAWSTKVGTDGAITTKSIGKQPSWIQYMTEVSECYGDFTAGKSMEFMTMVRKYRSDAQGNVINASTYVDPTEWNTPFADADISSQNFWVQVAIDCEVRRVMSAKQIPNL